MGTQKTPFFKTDTEVYDYVEGEIKDWGKENDREDDAAEYVKVLENCFVDNTKSIHFGLSPSKSPGWMECAAYIDRAKEWNGSKEPSVRGTMAHYMLSRILMETGLADYGDDGQNAAEFKAIMGMMLDVSPLVTKPGLESVRAAVKYAKDVFEETGVKWKSEVMLEAPTIGTHGVRKLHLGGSIDMLHITEDKIVVIDLKTGKNPVQTSSHQLKCYALLAVYNAKNLIDGFEGEWPTLLDKKHKFEVGICQFGKVQTEEFTGEDLLHFFVKLCDQLSFIEEYYNAGLNMVSEESFDRKAVEHPKCFGCNKLCRFCKGCPNTEHY